MTLWPLNPHLRHRLIAEFSKNNLRFKELSPLNGVCVEPGSVDEFRVRWRWQRQIRERIDGNLQVVNKLFMLSGWYQLCTPSPQRLYFFVCSLQNFFLPLPPLCVCTYMCVCMSAFVCECKCVVLYECMYLCVCVPEMPVPAHRVRRWQSTVLQHCPHQYPPYCQGGLLYISNIKNSYTNARKRYLLATPLREKLSDGLQIRS